MKIPLKIDSARGQLLKVHRQEKDLLRRIRELEQHKLTDLPAQFGLKDVDGLIYALTWHASAELRTKLHAIGVGLDEPAIDETIGEPGARPVRFTPELRERIRAELDTGQKTAAALSREYGLSASTIMSWKRQWGLTRPHARRSRSEHSGA